MTERQHFPDFEETEHLIDVRQDLLDEFAEHPDDDAVWHRAYTMVEAEGDGVPDGLEHTPAATVGAQELIDFAKEVRATPPTDRYELTAQTASDGRYWFDVLKTFSLDQPDAARLAVLDHYVMQRGGYFDRALDMGTGTGNSLWALEQVAEDVVGFDRNAALLAIARDTKKENTQLVRGEVTAMPFADGSFDLISSQGLEGAIPDEDTPALFAEVARVLQSDGIYVTSTVYPDESGFKGNEMRDICRTSKGILADMIVDTVSGGAAVQAAAVEPTKSFDEILQENALYAGYFRVSNEADGIDYAVRIISKTPLEPAA